MYITFLKKIPTEENRHSKKKTAKGQLWLKPKSSSNINLNIDRKELKCEHEENYTFLYVKKRKMNIAILI